MEKELRLFHLTEFVVSKNYLNLINATPTPTPTPTPTHFKGITYTLVL